MKKELSWIPLASGSEAIRALSGRRQAHDQADAIMGRNLDRNGDRGNRASFTLALKLVHTTEA